MKNYALLTFFILSSLITSGQKDTTFFFDEFRLSANRTCLKDDNTNNLFGFGIGVYHNFIADRKVNLIFGFEYNRTSQFVKYQYEGHYQNSKDITFHLNSLSIPLTARLNIGQTIKCFIDAGAFLDLNIGARSKGTRYTSLPNQNTQEVQYNEKSDFSSLNYGPSLGFGLKIPIEKHEIIFKSDYKFGLNVQTGSMDEIYNSYLRLLIGLKI